MDAGLFYRRLARRYDDLFPEDAGTTAALAAGLPPGSRVLDLACGTGTYAAALARLGYDARGLDLSEDLVRIGRSRHPALALMVADMRRFAAVAPGPYERILCIGNSLPHLRDEAEVAALLAEARAALVPGGSLIAQTVSFDRGPELASLPPLRAAGCVLERRYRWGRGRVVFEATLVEPDRAPQTASVRLLPLASSRLLALARDAGFADARVAGGFDGRPHASESFLTVLSARA